MAAWFNGKGYDVAIVSVKGNDYRIRFWYMSKDEAINIMKNFENCKIFFLIYV